jgi:carboxypeptidase family protein
MASRKESNKFTNGKARLWAAVLVTGILALSPLAGTVWGQVTASIIGTVRDASGAVTPGATVTVKHTESGLIRTAEADSNGNYTVPSLPVGRYEVSTEKPGFKQAVRRGINLVVGQEAVVNLTLEVGNVVEQVTVTAEASIVNTTLSPTSGLVSEQQVRDLPLNGRSFDQLLTLNTGTANYTSNTGSGRGGNFFSVVGRRPEENRFLVNGVDYVGSNPAGQPTGPYGVSLELLGVDAVREFNVVQHSYGAEYGKVAGGQVSIVTNSGTNELHGVAFEYLRNSVLDAARWEDNALGGGVRPPFKRNQFGGALGGPIKKNKIFLFGNYEGFRQRLAVSSTPFVPDADARRGFLPIGPGGSLIQVPGLKTGMLPYLNYFWPVPNGPELGGGVAYAYANPGQKINEDFGLVRFDQYLSAKDSYSVNYLIDDGDKSNPRPNPNFVDVSHIRGEVIGFQETHIFSPTVLNVVNFGYTRADALTATPPAVSIPANLSFITGRVPGQITIGGGVSTAAASSITSAFGNSPTRNVMNLFSAGDDVHFIRGKHSFSAGGWVQGVQQNLTGPAQNVAGTAAYPSLQALLTDSPTAFNANVLVTPEGFRSKEGAWYVQDEIKLRPNLTLRVGVRDEMTNGWNEVAGRCSNILFDQNGVPITDPFISHACLSENNAKALWQPRIGVAWDPTGTGTWAVRAGFGTYNDLQDTQGFRLASNPPYNGRLAFTGSGVHLLSLVPIDPLTPLAPTCNAQLVAAKKPCSTYSVGGVDPTMHTPTVEQWSLTVERGITKDLVLQVGYVGSEAYHTLLPMNLNAPHSQVCTNSAGCDSGGVNKPTSPCVSGPAVCFPKVPMGTTYIPPGPRPNPFMDKTNSQMFAGTSSYNALNVSLTERASHGLIFKTNYTFSKALDFNSAGSSASGTNQPKAILNPFDLKLSRGIAAFSLKHQFNANFAYELPFGKGHRFGGGASGALDKLIGGWQWNGIVTAQSGFPLTPQVGANTSGTGDTDNPDVPNWNPAFSGPVIVGRPDKWFDPNAFLLPTSGTFGNVSRGSIIGPGLTTFDTSLFKKVSINERWSVQLRVEAFNVFNHSNFLEPSAVIFTQNKISSSAGVIPGTATFSRQIQFALRLVF